jgi:hypothetical protein
MQTRILTYLTAVALVAALAFPVQLVQAQGKNKVIVYRDEQRSQMRLWAWNRGQPGIHSCA